jgi:alpha-L-fucosidase
VQDIRFTRNKANSVIYAIVLGLPERTCVVKALGTSAATNPGKILNVQMLGTEERVLWKQSADGLHIDMPRNSQPTTDFAASFKVSLS